MTRWLRRALLCAFAAGGVMAIGATSASADDGSIDAAIAADAEVDAPAEATADVELEIGLDLPDVSLAEVGSCACSTSESPEADAGQIDAADGEDLVVGGSHTGTIDGNGGHDGMGGDADAGIVSDAIDATLGSSTDQVLGAGGRASASSGAGDEQQTGSGDAKSDDPDAVGDKDGKDGGTDDSGSGMVDDSNDPMAGGTIGFTVDDGTIDLKIVDPVGILGFGDRSAGIACLCRTQFALAALEGIEILEACGVAPRIGALLYDVDGRLGLDADADVDALLSLHADDDGSTSLDADASLQVDIAGIGGGADPCGCDGTPPMVDATVDVDAAAAADANDDEIQAGLDLDVSAELAIG